MTVGPASRRKLSANDEHVLELIRAARVALDDLEHGIRDPKSSKRGGLTAPALVAGLERTDDGYAGSVRRDSGGRAVGSHADSVCELVRVRVDAELKGTVLDPVWRGAQTVLRGLNGAVADLHMAVGALAKAQPPPTGPGEPGCIVMARFAQWEPVYRSGRCRWVYDWWLFHGADPPDEVVKARIEGRRLTTKLLKDVGEQPKRRSGRRARR